MLFPSDKNLKKIKCNKEFMQEIISKNGKTNVNQLLFGNSLTSFDIRSQGNKKNTNKEYRTNKTEYVINSNYKSISLTKATTISKQLKEFVANYI